MSYNDATSIQKTHKSWWAAMQEILAICPHLSLHGSGITYMMGPNDFEPSYPSNSLVKHATEVHVSIEGLFEGGDPKNIRESHFLWRSDFFKPYFAITRPYQVFMWDFCHGEKNDGKPILKSYDATIRLHGRLQSYGLGDWAKHKKEIEGLFRAAKPDVRDKYISYVGQAEQEIVAWKRAVRAGLRRLSDMKV